MDQIIGKINTNRVINGNGVQNSTILLVDDSVDNIRLISEILNRQPENYQVHATSDGQKALNFVKSIVPDLILLDAVMPKMDGFEVCEQLKRDERTRLIPIVMITALDSQRDRLRGLDAGVDDFVSKPFNVYELLARVKNLLKLRSYINELEHAEQVIFSLAKAVEAKDKYTEGHCERLSGMADAMGQELGLSDQDLLILKRGGILHDIGKIAIKDAILLKPGPLTKEEFEIIKTHPAVGENICSPLKSLRPVLPVIRSHQERFNGSGYPDGLRGEEIPIHARIIGIVDCFDALTTERTYRKALPDSQAMEIIRNETDKGLWDPELFEILEDLVTRPEFLSRSGVAS